MLKKNKGTGEYETEIFFIVTHKNQSNHINSK